jgi:hypothetical protein
MIDDEIVQNVGVAQVIHKMGAVDRDGHQGHQEQDKGDKINPGFQCHLPPAGLFSSTSPMSRHAWPAMSRRHFKRTPLQLQMITCQQKAGSHNTASLEGWKIARSGFAEPDPK